jgi:hypothetical protein
MRSSILIGQADPSHRRVYIQGIKWIQGVKPRSISHHCGLHQNRTSTDKRIPSPMISYKHWLDWSQPKIQNNL